MKAIVITFILLVHTVFLIFMILKLTGNIQWSWWWVTSPLWLGVIITVICAAAVFVLGLYAFIWGPKG